MEEKLLTQKKHGMLVLLATLLLYLLIIALFVWNVQRENPSGIPLAICIVIAAGSLSPAFMF